MESKRKKAVIALSGGVDSSVAALILMQQGYEVEGITGRMTDTPAADIICENASRVAKKLRIKHHVVDVSKSFQTKVIDYFIESYSSGETPNPCIVCNEYFKWGEIFDYSINNLGADFFSTGHYAQIKNDSGIFKLFPAKDEHKDQLYFLYRLGQRELCKTLFPLFEYQKSQVRKIACDFNLPPKSSKESQDICFIQKPCTAKKYLTEKLGLKRGDFIDIHTGKKLGEHEGSYLYTVGQRKGIGIAASYPLYVIAINSEKNIVYLGKNEDNLSREVRICDLKFSYPKEEKEFETMVKIRYNMHSQKAHVKIEDNTALISFTEPVNSITSGQAGVFYDIDDGHLIGGGKVLR